MSTSPPIVLRSTEDPTQKTRRKQAHAFDPSQHLVCFSITRYTSEERELELIEDFKSLELFTCGRQSFLPRAGISTIKTPSSRLKIQAPSEEKKKLSPEFLKPRPNFFFVGLSLS